MERPIADLMEQPEENSLLSEDLSEIALRYPTITVYGTPASWLSQSQLITMASNTDDISCDDTASSLGDSAYEFIDDKSSVVSEDEDRGNSLLFPNDGRDIQLPPNHGGLVESMNKQGDQSPSAQPSTLSFDLDSSLTTISTSNCAEKVQTGDGNIPKCCGDTFADHNEDRLPSIVLEEARIISSSTTSHVEASHTIKIYKGDEIAVIFPRTSLVASPTQVTSTIKQTLASHGLVLDEPYKLLYIGDSSARDPIIQKIGSALAATLESEKARPSRFNVVPISSFGDSTSPEVVLIDSTGLELSVEECHSASFAKLEGGNDTISMTLSDRTLVESFWSGSKFAVKEQWRLPDIAVFYLSEHDNISAKQTRRFARSFMSRHTVPCIFVSQSPSWNNPQPEPIALDPITPHLCLQAYGSDLDKSEVVQRLPIDVQSFLSLDCRQMNRNLACLAAAYRRSRSMDSHHSLPSGADKHLDDGAWTPEKLSSIQKIFRSGLILMLGFFLYQFATYGVFSTRQLYRQNLRDSAAIPMPMLTKSTSPVSSPTRGDSTIIPISTSLPIKQYLTPRSRSGRQGNTDIASFLLDGQALVPNNSNKFKISVIGDSHVLLRPPHWFTHSKKASKLSFNVSRRNNAVSHQVSTLFDGVFAIQIPRDDAHGVLKVSVWTTSKPKINESFEVDFGTSSRWRRTGYALIGLLPKDINLVNTGLTAVSNHTITNLRSLIWRVQNEAFKARKRAETIGTASLDRTVKTTDVVLGQTMGISRALSKLGHGSLLASKQFMVCAERQRKDLTRYSWKKSIHTSRRAQQLFRAAFNVKGIAYSVVDYKNKHLRTTQKRALKFWWRFRGVPKHAFTTSGSNSKTRSSGPEKTASR